MLVTVIVACEIGFWVLLFSGLAARYVLRHGTLGATLLIMAPMVDLVLLTVTILDLRAGGSATFAHAVATIYLGISVGFGHRMVQAADVRFAHRFVGGPKVPAAPRYGAARAARERASWYRHLVAWAVGCTLMLLAVVAIGDPTRTEIFLRTASIWTVVLVVDGLFSWSYTVFPKKPPASSPADCRA